MEEVCAVSDPQPAPEALDPLHRAIRRFGAGLTERRRRARAQELDHTIKGVAKAVAQQMSESVADRRLRAAVRTRCYNELVPLLRQLSVHQACDRARYRRTSGTAAAAIALLTLGLCALLLGR